ncbi:DNA repair protein rad50 [Glugoides intestinalis]
MPLLEKLMIKGIRSFSPNESNVLEFHTPLTLIVGANGTGKTTIIECLKYITTGDLPPNARGGAFIYDPKIAKEIDVKAEVRLRFKNGRNESIECVRSMQSSMRKSKVEQKTLECSLSKEVNGIEVQITSKMADVDRDVSLHLGLYPSILENVIFCHQDESTWPIGDPTVIKKKLDDIFNSTKYNKALLNLKASKKEVSTDLKLKTQQISIFLKDKMKRDDILKSIQCYTEEIEKKNSKFKVFSDEILRITECMQTISTDMKILEKLEQNYRILKTEFDNSKRFVEAFGFEILESIDKELAVQRVKEIDCALMNLNSLNIEEEFVKIEILRKQVLEEAEKNANIERRIQETERGVKNLKLERRSNVEFLLNEFSCAEEELTEKITEIFNIVEINIKEKTKELGNDRECLMMKRNEQKSIEKLVEEKKTFISKHSHLEPGSLTEQVDIFIDYEKQIELEAVVDELLEDVSVKQCNLNEMFKASELVFKRKMLVESIEELRKELSSVSLETLERSLKKAQALLEQKKTNLKRSIEEEQCKKLLEEQNRRSNSNLILEIKALLGNADFFDEYENSSNKNEIESIKHALDTNNIDRLKESGESAIFNTEIPRCIEELQQEILSCKSKMENNRYADAIYRNFFETAKKNHNCPLCKREFNGEAEATFNTKLSGVLSKLPEIVKTTEAKLKDLQKSLDQFEKRNLEILKKNETRIRIKQLLEKLSNETVIKASTVYSLESEVNEVELEVEKHIQLYRDTLGKMNKLSDMELELAKIPEMVEMQPVKDDFHNSKAMLERARLELTEYIKEVKEKERLTKKKNEEKERQAIIKQKEQYIEDLKHIIIEDLKEEENLILLKETKLEKIKTNFMKSKMEVEQKKERNLEIDKQISKAEEEMSNDLKKLTKRFLNSKVYFNGREFEMRLLGDVSEYDKLRNEVLSHKNKIIKLAKEFENAKHQLKVVEENIKLQEAKERIFVIEKELQNFDMAKYGHLKGKYTTYEEKKIKLMTAESVIRGELKQIAQSLRTLNHELEGYQEANKNYLRCAIEIRILELSLEDMEKCINGLDKAIVDFHSTKIEEVNRALRELWGSTYKGNDIEYIELKSESSETRAYNYRLVMVKNGVELDMRGRSSAGQKMIASILFKIALAESFSNGCNILALDEPTTNLDKENIESLAQTLLLIIKERTDFQLIVITHDEDFVQLLNREGLEYFYRLKRDPKGNGYIERHSIYR